MLVPGLASQVNFYSVLQNKTHLEHHLLSIVCLTALEDLHLLRTSNHSELYLHEINVTCFNCGTYTLDDFSVFAANELRVGPLSSYALIS